MSNIIVNRLLMGEMLSLKVTIANRTYPLRITQEEHEKVLKSAELVNKRIREFEESYAVKDKQDLLAMAALQFANESMGQDKTEKSELFVKEMADQVEYLTALVDEYLAKESPSR
jgi:cell division protein ZapA (FtsZ GTPase activity inhibitor)